MYNNLGLPTLFFYLFYSLQYVLSKPSRMLKSSLLILDEIVKYQYK